MAARALFLDRDGVININHGYVHRQQDFHFIDGIFELCRAAQGLGYRIFVVTNQAGIGRGMYEESCFLALSEWMVGVFERESVGIDKVYYCPSHPVHGLGKYLIDSEFRKPRPGMILQAAREFSLDLAASVLLGDKETDIAAGRAAQVGRNVLYCPEGSPAHASAADLVISSLRQLVPHLKQ